MPEAMGATLRELMALENEGLLIPRTRIPKIKNPWRVSDGTAFVAELLTGPVSDNDWEALLLARKRTGVGLSDLIQAIREEQISVGQRMGTRVFTGSSSKIAKSTSSPHCAQSPVSPTRSCPQEK
ncbi:hypothetical protein [Sulfitobacter sp.]|uniref:hypothetical protein n=1 Tax=Sulfitobacter sp. TaxID=1903071 RepID=UPI00300197C1